jgi:hypothetical protein
MVAAEHRRKARRLDAEEGAPCGLWGGARPGAGRKPSRIPPEATRAVLDALRLPGETDAGMASRLGVTRQAVGCYRRQGVTPETLAAIREALAPN